MGYLGAKIMFIFQVNLKCLKDLINDNSIGACGGSKKVFEQGFFCISRL